MNAPDKNLRISVAPGVVVLKAARVSARPGVRQAALTLLTAMRRAVRGCKGASGRAYLKEVRAERHGR